MPWNWVPDWPKFNDDLTQIAGIEKQFLLNAGSAGAYLKTIDEQEYRRFVVEILSLEGVESSRIEGEIFDRESGQSSLKKKGKQESRMAELLCNVYESFNEPLTHEMPFNSIS